jgi:hypothetical protein
VRTVFIVDSHYPEDYFADCADGPIAQQILKALGIRADLRLALDREHFGSGCSRCGRQLRAVVS